MLVAALAVSSCGRSDASILAEASAKLAIDPALRDLTLAVQVERGVVRISGDTSSFEQQTHAVVVVEAVAGVEHVISAMTIGDQIVAEAVRAALAQDQEVGRLRIDVSVVRGIVRLESDDTDANQRAQAVRLAKEAIGVKGIDDHMR